MSTKRSNGWLYLIVAMLFTLFSLPPNTAVAATKTATISITTTILPACEAGSTTSGITTFGSFNFGTYSNLDQNIAVSGQANTGAIRVKCVAGVAYKVVMGAGNSGNVSQRYMMNSLTSLRINYNLYTDAAHLTIWNNLVGVSKVATGLDEWLPVYGMVPPQTTPLAGVYSDTVLVTVSW